MDVGGKIRAGYLDCYQSIGEEETLSQQQLAFLCSSHLSSTVQSLHACVVRPTGLDQ